MFSFLLQSSVSQIYINHSILTLPKCTGLTSALVAYISKTLDNNVHRWPSCLCTLLRVPLCSSQYLTNIFWDSPHNLLISSHNVVSSLSPSTPKSLPPSRILSLENSLVKIFTRILTCLPVIHSILINIPQTLHTVIQNSQRLLLPSLSYMIGSFNYFCLQFLYGWQFPPVRWLHQTNPSIISKDSNCANVTAHDAML